MYNRLCAKGDVRVGRQVGGWNRVGYGLHCIVLYCTVLSVWMGSMDR